MSQGGESRLPMGSNPKGSVEMLAGFLPPQASVVSKVYSPGQRGESFLIWFLILIFTVSGESGEGSLGTQESHD